MSDLDKAREWAEDGKGLYSPGSRAKAVTDIILSLPDQWVDVEEVRKILDIFIRESDSPANPGNVSRVYRECSETLEHLLAPKLPTLADMTREEQEACQWMQCSIADRPGNHLLIEVEVMNGLAWVLHPNEGSALSPNKKVTPLPDLPKLQWPSSIAQEPTGASLDPQENIDASIEYIKKISQRQSPRPEGCCGKCPETASGGWDCTCEDNPRCSKLDGESVANADVEKLSTQQDYREAPVGTVVKASGDEGLGLNVIVKDAENMWTNTSLGLCRTDFNMSGNVREVVTVIEVN